MKKQSTTDTSIISRPLRHKNGDILNDVEMCKVALKSIDDYSKTEGKPPAINPRFVEWLRGAVDYCDKGGKITEYKEKTIQKQYADLYDEIIENTNRRNAELSKKGAFNSKVVKRVEGRSK